MQFDLEEIKRTIAKKYDWGPSADWTNFHFKELSKDIEAATGDRLSEETLKRIFGKRKVNTESYQPQAFSQMVLMKYAEGLKAGHSRTNGTIPEKSFLTAKVRKTIWWVFGCGIFLAAVLFFTTPDNEPEKYRFSCKNPRDTYPFTAMFEYDVSEIDDSVFIDFGKDGETFLPPEKSMINYFYSNTGVYNVQVYTRKKRLDSLRVVAWAHDWQAGYFPNSTPEKFSHFMDQSFYRQPDCFYATSEGLKAEHVDLSQHSWTDYRYFSPFGKDLDHLSLETRVLNNASTGSFSCYDIGIALQGDFGTIDITFTQSKCSRYAMLKLSEKQMDGEYDDLSAFTVDMSDWLQLRTKTEEGNFKVYLGDKLIFTEQYQKPLGSLLGIRYYFFGSGKIDYIELKDSLENVFYRNDFTSTGTIAHK
ncbi:MAG: hypothetical protein A2W90_05435 [Bacteroidetes bacterium GWF2_42_66]|nr:MAG: hypothetical protein A2W92_03610 [Bacteroidetes bacterium GWA2_42_15]OFX96015.1 MAG: hypothetical protein A2W89_02845 [Bacteroidetes bacterium GWE2_42_39]OFY46588.1 MAG: hypothetical protein A2W90_05435 [Bacteroidetes bacterium GWF2_42_66]HBL75549.1 hypothetical protein [Prolixibacteraceae bacterium]HCR91082.1 hypothetical protein [Prolixibacteraceae bacterium]